MTTFTEVCAAFAAGVERGVIYLLPPQFAARFSANEASPSEASAVCRLAACIRTSRA